MSKRLTLLRHAKSDWQDASLQDHDRPLNKRGRRDAPMMGQRLQEHGARPSLILTSPAVRARETAKLIAVELNYPQEFIQRETKLYLASPESILKVLGEQDNGFNDIMLCAHNPGITELVNRLANASIDNVPTCGIVTIEVDIPEWPQLISATGTLKFFDYPKNTLSEKSA